MKIILKQDIVNLGEEGDIKLVKDGYARNFLIPKKMAALYSLASLNELEKKREAIAKRKEEKRKEARSYREKIEAEELTFKVAAGEKRRLFGAITNAHIVEELAKKGIKIERKKVEITDSIIKILGTHNVRVKLYGDEVAVLKVIVESNNEKAPAPEVVVEEVVVTEAEPVDESAEV